MATTIRVRTNRGEEYLDLEEFEARVARGEIAPQCPVQFAPVTGDAWVPAGALDIFRQNYSPRQLRFANRFTLGGVPRATLAFCVLNIAWYLAMRPIGSPEDTLIAYGANAGPLLLDLGQSWRLLSANFVHRNLLHIGMNLFVLFNFAGALENAFGAWNMALILFASALGTTVLSTAATASMSAGASGVAYGALGGAVVFGMKYRPLLPERYRRVLGGAVVPTVLVFFYIGLTSSGIDNWGHLGGFLAGSTATLFVRPRLLVDPSAGIPWRRIGAIGGGIAVVVLLGPLTRPFLPRTTHFVNDDLGLAIDLPSEWDVGASPLGGHSYFNGLPGYGEARLTLGGYPADDAPDLTAAVDELTKKGLWEPETDEKLQIRELAPPKPVALAEGQLHGLERRAKFVRGGIDYDFRALAVARGHFVYLIEAISSRAQPGYAKLFDRAIAGVSLGEPFFLRQARARRLFLPGSSEAEEGLTAAAITAGAAAPPEPKRQ